MEQLVQRARHYSALLFGVAFVWIGIQHFTNVEFFLPIVPKVLGAPEFWVYLSGIVEIILGLSLMFPMYRKTGAKATALFLVVIYWANANMWINDIPLQGNTFSTSAHLMRAMAQVAMFALAIWIAEIKIVKEKKAFTPSEEGVEAETRAGTSL
ncbi:MAG: DoxX family membrane protein [Candidatus Poseidoniaceae archaeon]|nr:DoxX family membrane protein [Candidatus Poseidoniaceae archaeon]